MFFVRSLILWYTPKFFIFIFLPAFGTYLTILYDFPTSEALPAMASTPCGFPRSYINLTGERRGKIVLEPEGLGGG